MPSYTVTGVMSGSSVDGVDFAHCIFHFDPDSLALKTWEFIRGNTVSLPDKWKQILRSTSQASAKEVAATHAAYGKFIGTALNQWHRKSGLKPQFIALHGHTLFHEPGNEPGFSTQLGDAALIATITGCPVITDFRAADIALGGQGAPMAPLADTILFPEYHAWINIGGIANITVRRARGKVKAWDVCGANQLLNALANEAGQSMDRHGNLGKKGMVIPELLNQSLDDPWFAQPPPRSMSNQQVQDTLIPLFRQYPAPLTDRIATAYDFLCILLIQSLPAHSSKNPKTAMVTGGGALNTFLMQKLEKRALAMKWKIVLPTRDLIHYKEGILMALAGFYRWHGLPNFLPSATGARLPACGGAIYLPPSKYLRHSWTAEQQ